MEGHPHQGLRGPPGCEQQGRGLVGGDAELAGQAVGCPIGLDAQPHDQIEVPGMAGGIEDLGQFVMAIEREGANAIVEIGLRYGRPALHRMHEGHLRAGGMTGHKLDLGDRGDVKAPQPLTPQAFDDPGRRVGLNSVENIAVEVCLEPMRRYGQDVRSHEGDRTFRRPLTDQVQGCMIRVQFT